MDIYTTVLVAAAVLPAAFLLRVVYRNDRLEKESPGMLISLIILGVISTLPAVILERVGDYVISGMYFTGTRYQIVDNFIVIGLSEEFCKYFFLRLRTWRSREFNCQYDGVVFAVFVSLGFAICENILYVFSYGFANAVVRAFTAIPGHASFGVLMGIFYGVAKRYDYYGNHNASIIARIMAVLVPAFVHGAYDFTASMETSAHAVGFLVLIVVLFAVCFILVKKVSQYDQYIAPDAGYDDGYGDGGQGYGY